jgi:hypothetical protein
LRAVAVCTLGPLLRQVTVSPWLIVIERGLNEKSRIVAEASAARATGRLAARAVAGDGRSPGGAAEGLGFSGWAGGAGAVLVGVVGVVVCCACCPAGSPSAANNIAGASSAQRSAYETANSRSHLTSSPSYPGQP